MFHPERESTHQPARQTQRSIQLPPADQSILRMFLLGDIVTVRSMIGQLASLGVADAKHWSAPQPTGKTGEYIAVHTRRMRADTQ